MSPHSILLYLATVFVASILPGPSMLLALTHGMQYGAKRTVASALGNLSVTMMQAAVSMAGLGVILLASATLFLMIKWVGAAYLIYMGFSLWKTPGMKLSTQGSDTAPHAPLRKMYLQGALVTAGNPKAIVFFTAVFPQFIDPNDTYLSQFALLLSSGGVIAFGCFMIYAIGGQKIIPYFSRSKLAKHLNKLIGGTFIGVGIGLATTNR
ncbi:MAG: LysE family translocator [Proteobacteria bacterium]|nr:LysE family translocator [Pseudomonadota bacterium]MBU1686059.1 LysE family translocator [Pseudomonadota bacterium]